MRRKAVRTLKGDRVSRWKTCRLFFWPQQPRPPQSPKRPTKRSSMPIPNLTTSRQFQQRAKSSIIAQISKGNTLCVALQTRVDSKSSFFMSPAPIALPTKQLNAVKKKTILSFSLKRNQRAWKMQKIPLTLRTKMGEGLKPRLLQCKSRTLLQLCVIPSLLGLKPQSIHSISAQLGSADRPTVRAGIHSKKLRANLHVHVALQHRRQQQKAQHLIDALRRQGKNCVFVMFKTQTFRVNSFENRKNAPAKKKGMDPTPQQTLQKLASAFSFHYHHSCANHKQSQTEHCTVQQFLQLNCGMRNLTLPFSWMSSEANLIISFICPGKNNLLFLGPIGAAVSYFTSITKPKRCKTWSHTPLFILFLVLAGIDGGWSELGYWNPSWLHTWTCAPLECIN